MATSIKNILLVSPRTVFSEGLKQVLLNQIVNNHLDEYEINWVKDYMGLIKKIRNNKLELIIIDCIYSTENIDKTISLIKSIKIDAKILCIFDKYDDNTEIELVKLGVRGIIYEESTLDIYKKCFNCIISGQFWVRRNILEKVVLMAINNSLTVEDVSSKNVLNELTSREINILKFIVQNYTNRQISSELYITEKTVKNNLTKIYKKLKINNRDELKTLVIPLNKI
ncbi:MAG: LuxR C-terminal-related transcriptional regulator [Thermodesulfobacteriota bacterium]